MEPKFLADVFVSITGGQYQVIGERPPSSDLRACPTDASRECAYFSISPPRSLSTRFRQWMEVSIRYASLDDGLHGPGYPAVMTVQPDASK